MNWQDGFIENYLYPLHKHSYLILRNNIPSILTSFYINQFPPKKEH